MKKLIVAMIILITVGVASVKAYAPLMFDYEAIARSDNGFPFDNSILNIRISIFEGNDSKRMLYQEVQKVKTNAIGQFNTAIGRGKAEAGSMAYFTHGCNYNFLKIEVSSIGKTPGKITFECIKCGLKGRSR